MKLSVNRQRSIATQDGRVRNPVGRSFKSIRGKYPSQKMGRMIQWESQLERDTILLLEYSPDIVAYQEQPRKVIYIIDGKMVAYFPDFEVWHADQRHGYIEVKPDEIAQRKDQKERFVHIEAKLADEGSYFLVMTEKQIRKQPLLRNLQMVERYRSCPVRPTRWPEFQHLFKDIISVSFAEAQALVRGAEHVWALIADGVFIFDLRVEVTSQSNLLINRREA